ncbi:oligosaccharide flippase family protein [Sulfuracidifex tepidarius]|uniref:Polysaccharide biosynthesis protein C-terminal domain-containing protein n=1 Tax=Sulfuracidifex tepidarius TaxID=1294262 RepID=A0A510E0B6_9CREN|nr:oligosaccharide flippase family protein [Sulfuracidifex tepidarius]BBG25936.1 hypothetical protein IC007_0441 [Sulfuracidifex tepidarius]
MNPIRNLLKYSSITTTNIIVALIFFLITAKISTPSFFGEVAILQLLEVITYSAFYLIPAQIITREISYLYAKGKIDRSYLEKITFFPFLVLPLFLFLILFPNYVRFFIPYLFFYLLGNVFAAILIGMDMFTENSISANIFLIIRWILSIIAVITHNIYLFLGIWITGSIISATLSYIFITRRTGLFFPKPDLPFIWKQFRGGLTLYFSNLSNFFSSQGDRLITAYLLGSYYLGIYQFEALVANVPAMVLGAINNVLLPSASFYRALGKDEKKMASLSFRLISLISLSATVLFIPISILIIQRFFPGYKVGLEAMVLLTVASTLSFPFISLTNMIIAFRKDLRPFLFYAILSMLTVIITSFILIPKLGIIGGAISQILVSTISSLYMMVYSIRTSTFVPKGKEIFMILIVSFTGAYEVLIDSFPFNLIPILIVLLLIKIFKIIERNDIRIIETFLPIKLRPIIYLLRFISS